MRIQFEKGHEGAFGDMQVPIRGADAHRCLRSDIFLSGYHFFPLLEDPTYFPVRGIELVELDIDPDSEPLFFDFYHFSCYFTKPCLDKQEDAGILFLRDCKEARKFEEAFSKLEPGGCESASSLACILLGWATTTSQGIALYASDWVHKAHYAPTCLKLINKVRQTLGAAAYTNPPNQPKVERPPKAAFGADPEFEAVRDGSVIQAGNLDLPYDGRIGLDGTGQQVELRPRPTASPITLYRRIRELATEAMEEYDFDLSIAGHRYPLGCHIHIGPTKKGWHVTDSYTLACQIDKAVGELVDLSGRARGYYGQRLQYDSGKSHGGFEYRTLPSAILASENLFVSVLEAIRAAIYEEPIPELPSKELKKLKRIVDGDYLFSFDYSLLQSRWSGFEFYEDAFSWYAFERCTKVIADEYADHALLKEWPRITLQACRNRPKIELAGQSCEVSNEDGFIEVGIPASLRMQANTEVILPFLGTLIEHLIAERKRP